LWDFQIDDALGVGDIVVAVGRLSYRGKASGVSSTVSMGWVFRFEHGKLVYVTAFRDPEQTLGAVGRPA
jgi:ketosteroid isomerase-like protein